MCSYYWHQKQNDKWETRKLVALVDSVVLQHMSGVHDLSVSLISIPLVLTTMDIIIQETIQYTRQRKIFKQPVLYHQAVHFRLAELQTEVELLRSLLHRATGGVN